MATLSVAVLGAGVGGLAAALALARGGHAVTLIERDELTLGEAVDAVDWRRQGIPHFRQAHAFTSRGRRELRALFPDVYQALLDAGAHDVDLRPKLRGPLRPEDEELQILGVRRALIEWALRGAMLREPGITVRSGVQVVGLDGTTGDVPRVTGVRTGDGSVRADLVVDAMGRRSPVPDWIEGLGGHRMGEASPTAASSTTRATTASGLAPRCRTARGSRRRAPTSATGSSRPFPATTTRSRA